MSNHLFVTYALQGWVIPAVVAASVLVFLVAFLPMRKKGADIGSDILPLAYTTFAVLIAIVCAAAAGHTPHAWITQVDEARIVVVKDVEASAHTVDGVEMEVGESKTVATMVCPIGPGAAAPLDCERLDGIPVEDLEYGADHGPVSSVDEAVKKAWGELP